MLEARLKSRVVKTSPAAAQFFVDSGSLPASMAKRVKTHFVTFQQASRFASQAANEIVGIQDKVVKLLNSGGKSVVRNELRASAESWAALKMNCWQAALYSALASDNWYCKGGCRGKWPIL